MENKYPSKDEYYLSKIKELQEEIYGLQLSINHNQTRLQKIEKQLHELPDEPKDYKKYYPKVGDRAWYVDSWGDVENWDIFDGTNKYFLQNTIFFRTEAEARRYKEIHTTIIDIAAKYPVGDETEEYFELSISKEGKCEGDLFERRVLKYPHIIRASEDISDEINKALSTDDLLFYRSVT